MRVGWRRKGGAKTGIVNPLFWILVAPLAWALGLCLVALARERDPRILAAIGFLAALGFAERFTTPESSLELTELAASGQLVPVLGTLALNIVAALAAALTARSLRERNQAEHRRWLDLELLHDLPDATLRPGRNLEADLARLLAVGCRQLDCEIGIVSGIDGDTWEIRACHGPLAFETGDRLALRSTFCHATVEHGGPSAWDSRQERPPGCPLHFKRTLGVALQLAGQVVGTLCFARPDRPGEPFSSAQERHLGLVAQAVIARLALDPVEFPAAAAAGPNSPPRATGRSAPRKPATPASVEERLEVARAIRHRRKPLVASLGRGFSLSFQLDDEGAEVPLAEATFSTLLFSLVRHAEACFDEDEAPAVLTLESSRIEAEGAPGQAPCFATVSVHAPSSRVPDAAQLADLFESNPADHPELPSLSELRRVLQTRGGDLSVHSARGVGVTLTLFLPLCSENGEKSDSERDAP